MAATRRPGPIVLVLVAVVVLGLVAVVVSAGGEDDAGDGGREPADDRSGQAEVGEVAVDGAALPSFERDGVDEAIGEPAPTLTGTALDGRPLTIGGTGPTIVIFVAHWCPHCQAEVPEIVDWLASEGMPEGVAFAAVSTSVDERAPNHPPSSWLEREGWAIPTMADDEQTSAAIAYGLSAFPYFVALDADGNVAQRASGEIGVEGVEALVAAARR